MDADRERTLLAHAQAGDRAAMSALCASHLRLVLQIACRFERPGVPPEDLVSEGSLGLIEAIRRFDLAQPTRLSTYAGWWIRARIRKYAYDHRSVVPAPSTRGVRVARAQLAGAERALTQALGRAPTRAELASMLQIPEADVASVVITFSTRNLSLTNAPDGHPIELRDERAGPEEELGERESQRLLEERVQSALSSLGERDRLVIRAHLMNEESTMADLGSTLGVTRQRVSQIVHRVRKKLEKDLRRVAC